MCAGVGILVTLFSKPDHGNKLNGLTVFDVHKLNSLYKGSEPNEIKGIDIIFCGHTHDALPKPVPTYRTLKRNGGGLH